ncbi:MAG: alpha/beta fold hydrolase [Candidatus Abyssubacteria bacterium]
MRLLGEFLANSGHVVRGMLLPGHGTRPEDLEGVVWQDWYEHLDDEHRALKGAYSSVYLVGFSIGAALSAHYAIHNPVDRLVLLSLPLCPLNDRFPTSLMLKLYSVFFKEVRGRPARAMDSNGDFAGSVYNRVPTAILHTMSELVDIVRENLNRIDAPALIIQSRNDPVSGSKSGPLAFRRMRSPEKQILMLERSGHSVIMDVERELVCERVASFLNGNCSA